jgi:hypothetical protein
VNIFFIVGFGVLSGVKGTTFNKFENFESKTHGKNGPWRVRLANLCEWFSLEEIKMNAAIERDGALVNRFA